MSTYNADETAKVKHLILLAQAINDKIDGAGSETDTDSRATATLSLTKTSWTMSTDHTTGDYVIQTNITYNGDGDLYIKPYNAGDFSAQIFLVSDVPTLQIAQTKTSGATAMTFNLEATATDNYKAASLTFTVAP